MLINDPIAVSPLDVTVAQMPTSGLFYVEAFSAEDRACWKHEHLFEDEEEAVRLMGRVITRGAINPQHWLKGILARAEDI